MPGISVLQLFFTGFSLLQVFFPRITQDGPILWSSPVGHTTTPSRAGTILTHHKPCPMDLTRKILTSIACFYYFVVWWEEAIEYLGTIGSYPFNSNFYILHFNSRHVKFSRLIYKTQFTTKSSINKSVLFVKFLPKTKNYR